MKKEKIKKEKNIQKIRQNKDVKARIISGKRQLKEYFFYKRENLTQEEISIMIDVLVGNAMELAYEAGWEDRNEIYTARRSEIQSRGTLAFNTFYDINVGKIPVPTMEEFRFVVDVALQRRYYNPDYPLDIQVHNYQQF